MSLSPPQIRAAELLAKGHSHQEVGDAVGVSRRTILRWLKQEDFKNLSYGLVGRSQSPPPQRPPERREQSADGLTPQDLVQDALEAVRDVLLNAGRPADRLKAAALVGDWAGLCQRQEKIAETEAVKILIESGWLSSELINAVADAGDEFNQKMQQAFLSLNVIE